MHTQHKRGLLLDTPVAVCAERQQAVQEALDEYLGNRGASSKEPADARESGSAQSTARKMAAAPTSNAEARLLAL